MMIKRELFLTDCDKESIRSILFASGACAVGFAKAEPVDSEVWRGFSDWLSRGDNAGMEYMYNYPDLRRDPRLLLDGARTVISIAYSYAPAKWRNPDLGEIAAYAYGKDYHKVLRKLLKPALNEISATYSDSAFRICIDSAPVLERYWAQKAGIGFIGDNSALIVPGYGSMVFLVEILTTLDIAPDNPDTRDCGHCGACRKACPGKAIIDNCQIDCRRCISYLTIEHRGEWILEESSEVMKTEAARNSIYGCDTCLRVCPHNRGVPPTSIEDFHPSIQMLSLSFEYIKSLKNSEDLQRLIPGSPMTRAGVSGLLRNISPDCQHCR